MNTCRGTHLTHVNADTEACGQCRGGRERRLLTRPCRSGSGPWRTDRQRKSMPRMGQGTRGGDAAGGVHTGLGLSQAQSYRQDQSPAPSTPPPGVWAQPQADPRGFSRAGPGNTFCSTISGVHPRTGARPAPAEPKAPTRPVSPSSPVLISS